MASEREQIQQCSPVRIYSKDLSTMSVSCWTLETSSIFDSPEAFFALRTQSGDRVWYVSYRKKCYEKIGDNIKIHSLFSCPINL